MYSHLAATVLSLLSIPCSWVPCPRSQGHVHVVDAAGGPGTDFTDLSQAVSGAADGDLLLVRAGDHRDAISLDGKGLSVVTDVGAAGQVIQVSILNLPAGRFALLQGLASRFNSSPMELLQDQGPIWFEGCNLEPSSGWGRSPRAGFFIGTIPASGSLVFQTGAPDLPTGVESALFFSQAFFRDAATRRFVASAPSAVVVLDSAFLTGGNNLRGCGRRPAGASGGPRPTFFSRADRIHAAPRPS